MIEDKKNIDKLFHDVLFNDEHDVPDYVWDNIKDDLLAKKRKRNRIILRNIAASIIILLTFAGGYFFTDLFPTQKEKSLQSEINKENLEVKKELKINLNSDKKSLNQKNNKDFNTQNQNNLIFQNKSQNKVLLAATKKNKPEIINNIKDNKTVTSKRLLTDMKKNDNSIKSTSKNKEKNKIVFKKLHLLKADKIGRQLKLEKDLIYTLREAPMINVNVEKKKKSHWSVEGQFSPLYAFRDAKEVNADYCSSANSSNYSKEEPIPAYSVGASLRYNVSNRVKLQAGIYYSKTGQVTKNTMLLSASMYDRTSNKYLLNTTIGNVIQASNSSVMVNNVDNLNFSNSINSDIIQNFNYIEIPAIIKYKIIDKKIDVNILSGVNTSFLVGNNVTVKTDAGKQSVGKTTDINSIIYSGMFGVNLVYPLFKNFSFSIEPTAKYSLTSINKYNSVYLYSFAVFSGINFSFK